MLSPEIARRLDRLLASREKGIFTDEELAAQLGDLVTADNIGALLERLPHAMLGAVKRGIALSNRRAADNECLWPEDSPLHRVPIVAQYYHNVSEALLEPGNLKR
jgi:hypothetical protein